MLSRVLRAVALVALGALALWGGIRVFQMPNQSDLSVVFIVRLAFLPIPIPTGFFKSTYFWGGALCLLGAVLGTTGFVRFGKRS
jgi:hypothetical protein